MISYPEYIDKIIDRYRAAGESAYIVGGCLRDMLIGVPPHDYDIATSALPETTARLFSDVRIIETGIRHGTLTLLIGNEQIEVTTFRVDGEYTDSRHPDSVSFTRRIEEDLSRRDFTVNAMAYNRYDGLVDVFGGKADIEKKMIRAVGDAKTRFCEDALRIMRAFRFCAQLGFEIDGDTRLAAEKCAQLLCHVARERITAELLRLICSPHASGGLAALIECGAQNYVLGGFEPSARITDLMERVDGAPETRLALLLSEADEETVDRVLCSLRLSNKQLTATRAILRGARERIETPADARRLIAKTGVYAKAAAELSEALGISGAGACDVVSREADTPCSVRELAICGRDIAALGVRGKRIGEVLNVLLDEVIDDPSLNKIETLTEMAKKYIEREE